jgi:hypothetical protein
MLLRAEALPAASHPGPRRDDQLLSEKPELIKHQHPDSCLLKSEHALGRVSTFSELSYSSPLLTLILLHSSVWEVYLLASLSSVSWVQELYRESLNPQALSPPEETRKSFGTWGSVLTGPFPVPFAYCGTIHEDNIYPWEIPFGLITLLVLTAQCLPSCALDVPVHFNSLSTDLNPYWEKTHGTPIILETSRRQIRSAPAHRLQRRGFIRRMGRRAAVVQSRRM